MLTLPYRLRYALAWDHRLCRAVLAVFIRAVLTFERRRAARRGVRGGVGGAVTGIQRFGSALNVNVHFHSLVVQGVFVQKADGTRAIRFEPSELLEKLAAMIPRPRINLLVYHGVFGPHARARTDAVRRAREGAGPEAVAPGGAGGAATTELLGDTPPDVGAAPAALPVAPGAPEGDAACGGQPAARPPPQDPGRRRHYTWARLLERTFAIDVLNCPDCGGRLRFLATLEQRTVIDKILRHLGLPTAPAVAAPARLPPRLPGCESASEQFGE